MLTIVLNYDNITIMKQNTIKIKLSNLISKSISSRQAVKLIEDRIFAFSNYNKTNVILDFSNVNFISRSFADEILDLKEKLKNKKIYLKFMDTNNEINKMFKITSFHRENKTKAQVNLKAVDLESVACQF